MQPNHPTSVNNQQEESLLPIKHRRSSTNHFRKYDIWVARKLGSLEAAILLAELSNRVDYHEGRGELYADKKHGGGWFYFTHELAYERTFLARWQQDAALRILIKRGLVAKRVFGVPPKRYFRLNDEAIDDLYREPCTQKAPQDTVSANLLKTTNWTDPTPSICMKPTNPICMKPTNCPRGETACHLLYKETLRERDIIERESVEREQAAAIAATPPAQEKTGPPSKKAAKTAYRENVRLSEAEYWKLGVLHGDVKRGEMLDILDAYKGATGRLYKSDYHTLLPAGWVIRRWAEDKAREKKIGISSSPKNIPVKRGMTQAESIALAERRAAELDLKEKNMRGDLLYD